MPAESSTYVERLRAAVERTTQWKLTCPGSETFSNAKPSTDSMASVVTRSMIEKIGAVLQTPTMHRPGDCTGPHYEALMRMLYGGWPEVPVLTVGDVLVNGRPRYNVSRQTMRQELRAGREQEGAVPFHVWLTFPDLRILDFVLRPALERDAGRK